MVRQSTTREHGRIDAHEKAAHWILIGYLTIAILLGGASSYASVYAVAFNFLSVLLFAYCVTSYYPSDYVRIDKVSFGLVVAFCVYAALQLVPMPPSIWQRLPGRDLLARGLHLIARDELPWFPLSVDPPRTVTSLLNLLPLAIIGSLTSSMRTIPAKSVALTVVILSILSMIIGFVQVIGGKDSLLYVHSYTNWGLAVGFFANANHLATLVLISIPLCAATLSDSRNITWKQRTVLFGAFGITSLVAIYCASSVAGFLMWTPATAAGIFLLQNDDEKGGSVGLLLGLVVAGSLVGALWAGGLLPSLQTDTGVGQGSRVNMARTTLVATRSFWPVGSGLGTFEYAYRLYENPRNVTPKFANHAHNEYLEWVMELGAIGLAFVATFIGWWIREAARVWRQKNCVALWRKASATCIGLTLLHSVADYPLRTSAILTLIIFQWLVLNSRDGDAVPTVQDKLDTSKNQ